MFNFSAEERRALVFLLAVFVVLILIFGIMRLAALGERRHTLYLQLIPTSKPIAKPPVETREEMNPPFLLGKEVPSPLWGATKSSPAGSQKPASARPFLGKINVNNASAPELEMLPGIGPVLASRICKYREQHGPFQTAQELLKVQGIGRTTLQRIGPFLEF